MCIRDRYKPHVSLILLIRQPAINDIPSTILKINDLCISSFQAFGYFQNRSNNSNINVVFETGDGVHVLIA